MTTDPFTSAHSQLAIVRSMGVRREEYLDHMTFAANRQPLFCELFGPLLGLKEEWRAQGATPAELDFSAFRFREPLRAHLAVATGWLGGPPTVVLEETADYVLGRDRMGRRIQLFKNVATLPLPLDHPVKTMDDWRRVKPHYAFSEARFGQDWLARARQAVAAGRVLTAGIPGGFDEPRQLMGEENLCLAYYLDPELVHDILATIGETAFQVLERATREITVDCLSVHEDMAGKSGPLAGPIQIREFIKPYYRRIWDMLAERGTRLFDQDSDGNMTSVIEAFLDCGVNCMHPLEPAAGMDIVTVRRTYGKRLALRGGIDKHVLRRSREEIVAELEAKIPPMIRSGGCELSLDHRIPNGTPLANYRFYHAKAWEILKRETGIEKNNTEVNDADI